MIVFKLTYLDKEGGGDVSETIWKTREAARELLVEIAEEVMDQNDWLNDPADIDGYDNQMEEYEAKSDFALDADHFYLVDTAEVTIEEFTIQE